jgi:endogenous inhibitor of DNA gyrase (YacG/DUF329 family)
LKCANCGKEVANEDAVFCPYCAKPVKALHKRTPFPLAAGILTIIGSCVAIGMGLLYIVAALTSWGYGYGYIDGLNIYYVTTGIFGIISFSFGLTSGIFALKRRRIAFSIFGLSLLITAGIMMSIPVFVYGLPIAILSILSVIFVAISKAEFS